ncbi:MAG: N-methyl-L-tryptophan oxidase [Candidatus Promineifilaceae bacterium]
MTGTAYELIVIGAGIFGLTAAIELRQRGYRVALLDPGPLPHELAASTDISKVVRMDYGADELYMRMGEAARQGWLAWNKSLFAEPLYHEVGMLFLNTTPMSPHSYEYESYQMLQKRGHQPERLNALDIAARFPAWREGVFVDGYLNPQAGYAESGRVVEALLRLAQESGVSLHTNATASRLLANGSRVIGVQTAQGASFFGDHIVVAAGAWTPLLVPDLGPVMVAVGQPVFHLKAPKPDLFQPPNFTVFAADISQTGWYGFPWHPQARVVKIANHGVGRRIHPARDPRQVSSEDIQFLRSFLTESLPMLAEAPIVYTRVCLYCDTLDEHFWIDRHPSYTGLTVSAGGSGHAFKFAPLLGSLTADAVEGKPNPFGSRFRWRELGQDTRGEEAARNHHEWQPAE